MKVGVSPCELGVQQGRTRRPHPAAELSAAVLADLLNLSIATAVGRVNSAGGDWSHYAAALAHEAIADISQ